MPRWTRAVGDGRAGGAVGANAARAANAAGAAHRVRAEGQIRGYCALLQLTQFYQEGSLLGEEVW